MNTYKITLTENDEGFWLAECSGTFGKVATSPSLALASLLKKLELAKSGAIIMKDLKDRKL